MNTLLWLLLHLVSTVSLASECDIGITDSVTPSDPGDLIAGTTLSGTFDNVESCTYRFESNLIFAADAVINLTGESVTFEAPNITIEDGARFENRCTGLTETGECLSAT